MSHSPRRRMVVPLALALSCLPALSATAAPAGTFPTRPVTMIIPFQAGGGPDATFRMLSSEAEKELGRKIVIVNRPGPGGALGVAETIMAKPDGYTVGFCAVAIATIQPLLQDVPYKGPEDLMPLVQTGEAPTLIYVRSDSPYRTLADLIEDARKRPGQVSLGVTGAPYNLLHVQFVLLERLAGVKFNFVPYGSADHLPAVLGGIVPAAIGQVALLTQHIGAGTTRALAVFGDKRAKLLPDVPLVKELGYDITDIPYEFVIGPKGIPKEPADTLIAAFGNAVKSQAFREYGERTGLVVSYAGPEELARKLRADAERHRKLVEELGWARKK